MSKSLDLDFPECFEAERNVLPDVLGYVASPLSGELVLLRTLHQNAGEFFDVVQFSPEPHRIFNGPDSRLNI